MPWTNDKYISKFKFKDDKEQNKPFTAERLDEAVTDIAEGISQTLHVGGDNYMKAPLKMNGNKITGLAPGVNVSDAATVGQASGGGVFAVDNSTDAAKINLEQIPLKTATEYKDGMQISFVVKNSSNTNNIQLQLNGIGYKRIIDTGVGCFIEDGYKTVVYRQKKDVFERIDLYSHNSTALTIVDFNDLIYSCRFRINGSNPAKNSPNGFYWGIITVETSDNGTQVRQTLFTDDGNLYTRASWGGSWQAWRKMVTEDELNRKLDPILALAKAGTKNGLFKFTPKQGVLGRAKLYPWLGGEIVFNYSSGPTYNKIKNPPGMPPINTNLWFYLFRDYASGQPVEWASNDVWIGYLTNSSDTNSIEWWYSSNPFDRYGNLQGWGTWTKSAIGPWDNDYGDNWSPA